MDWIIGILLLLGALTLFLVLVYGLCMIPRFFLRAPKPLKGHFLTAIVWTLVTIIQTVALVVVPDQAAPISYVILLASGSVWVLSWMQFVQRYRSEGATRKRLVLPLRLYIQTLWGPFALWSVVIAAQTIGQHWFESAILQRDLTTAIFLRDCGLGNAESELLRGKLNGAIQQQDAVAVAIYLAAGTPTGRYYGADDDEARYVPAMEIAVRQPSSKITEILLTYGDSGDEVTSGEYDSMLHLAVKSGNVNQVRTLLRHGAERKVYNSDGLTPFQVAKKLGNKEMMATLLQPSR